MTTKREILVEARGLLDDVDNWCRRHFAINHFGEPTNDTTDACGWCLVGAVRWGGEKLAPYGAMDCLTAEAECDLDAAARRLYEAAATTVNDYYGYEAALAVLDAAIAEA